MATAPKCRTCGVSEWRHVCAPRDKMRDKVASVTKAASELVTLPSAFSAGPSLAPGDTLHGEDGPRIVLAITERPRGRPRRAGPVSAATERQRRARARKHTAPHTAV